MRRDNEREIMREITIRSINERKGVTEIHHERRLLPITNPCT